MVGYMCSILKLYLTHLFTHLFTNFLTLLIDTSIHFYIGLCSTYTLLSLLGVYSQSLGEDLPLSYLFLDNSFDSEYLHLLRLKLKSFVN